MLARAFTVIPLMLICVVQPVATWAQDTRSPDPLITRPGGTGNVSRYEYAPEDQPKLVYEAPPTDGQSDLFGSEVDILRDQLRDLQNEVAVLRDENQRLKAYNETLLRERGKAE